MHLKTFSNGEVTASNGGCEVSRFDRRTRHDEIINSLVRFLPRAVSSQKISHRPWDFASKTDDLFQITKENFSCFGWRASEF